MSSRQIIFEGNLSVPSGTEVEITVAWPARLDERVGLQLWIRGCVLHTLAHGITAEIRKYQFRTRSIARETSGAPACRQPASDSLRALAVG